MNSNVVITVCKRYKFSAAHYLPEHPSDCCNVHGHTFWADIYARGPVKQGDHVGREKNMVIEYSRLSEAWESLKLDHSNLNNMFEYPTTEVVAEVILSKMHSKIPEVVKVKLWEGPGQFVEVEVGQDSGGSEKPRSRAMGEIYWMPVGVAKEDIPAGHAVYAHFITGEVVSSGYVEPELPEGQEWVTGGSPFKKDNDKGADASGD